MTGKFAHEDVLANILEVKRKIQKACEVTGRNAQDITILAATKTVDADTINFALDNGITTIGENRVQELLEKYDAIDKSKADIHFIGRLQTNKVKYIIDKVSMIHSVDSVKLAAEIDKQAKKHGLVMNVLVEINIGGELSKGGVEPEQAEEFLRQLAVFENIKICGLMTIPPKVLNNNFDENNEHENAENAVVFQNGKKIYKNREYFKKIMKLFLDISDKNIDNIYMHELSMGMSEDYDEAVECGATIVRIGRTLFGAR